MSVNIKLGEQIKSLTNDNFHTEAALLFCKSVPVNPVYLIIMQAVKDIHTEVGYISEPVSRIREAVMSDVMEQYPEYNRFF